MNVNTTTKYCLYSALLKPYQRRKHFEFRPVLTDMIIIILIAANRYNIIRPTALYTKCS